MCGIAGIFHPDSAPVDRGRLQQMIDVLAHRGPDGEGMWIDDTAGIGLAHRRLSILDLSDAGRQPMHYEGRFILTYNGELYNYLEIREELKKKGHHFNTETDTEVLLAAYAEYGERCLQIFDGMFAFALWDREKRELFCARDRFGEKPFYYHYLPGRAFAFASEMKALFAAGAEQAVSNDMLFRYLAFDVVEDPLHKERTFYEGILSLPAAHYLVIGPEIGLRIEPYYRIGAGKGSFKGTVEEAAEQFEGLFKESVSRRLRSDVAVGSSLSGGLDSSSVVAAINKLLSERKREGLQSTFSARFDDPAFDEGPFMAMLEERFGLRAFHTFPDSNTLISEIDTLFYHQEEPFGSGSILAQWEVMKLAGQSGVTVLLDGQGADEILAGYHKYFEAYLRELWLQDRKAYNQELRALRSRHAYQIKRDIRWWGEIYFPSLLQTLRKTSARITSAFRESPFHPEFLSRVEREEAPFRNYNTLNDTLNHDCMSYGLGKLLRFSDRNAMAFSREVRLPFLSYELVDFVFSLPARMKIHDGWTKYVLRRAMSPVLPEAIAWRVDKKGFAPPQQKWLQNPGLRTMIDESRNFLLREKYIKKQGGISDWQLLMAYKLLTHRFNAPSV